MGWIHWRLSGGPVRPKLSPSKLSGGHVSVSVSVSDRSCPVPFLVNSPVGGFQGGGSCQGFCPAEVVTLEVVRGSRVRVRVRVRPKLSGDNFPEGVCAPKESLDLPSLKTTLLQLCIPVNIGEPKEKGNARIIRQPPSRTTKRRSFNYALT